MCVCMYVCVCACVRACVRVCMYVCMYVRIYQLYLKRVTLNSKKLTNLPPLLHTSNYENTTKLRCLKVN